MSRIANSDKSTNSDYINAVDNLNYLLIENYNLNFYNKSFNQVFDYKTKFENIEAGNRNNKRINYEKFSILQALNMSTGANHALTIEDGKYYFNNLIIF